MASPHNTSKTLRTVPDLADGSDEELDIDTAPPDEGTKNVLTPEPGNGSRKIVGEMVYRLYNDMTSDVQFPVLGLLGPGRLEQAMPFILNKLMQAIAAKERETRGLPPQVNLD